MVKWPMQIAKNIWQVPSYVPKALGGNDYFLQCEGKPCYTLFVVGTVIGHAVSIDFNMLNAQGTSNHENKRVMRSFFFPLAAKIKEILKKLCLKQINCARPNFRVLSNG